MIDFRLGERGDALRAEVEEFLAEEMTAELVEQIHRTGTGHDDGFREALRQRGWLAPGWPVEYGGQAHDPLEVCALNEELQRYHAPVYGINTTMIVAGAIRELGTEEQKRTILPRALGGEIVIALGFTEPECGSDVAAAATKAVRDGNEWVINGQKMFTTNAHVDNAYVFLLTRTNPDVPKHKGLTTFLVPINHPGVELQAVDTIAGERTNITFLSDVRVPDEWRIGDVDGGWTVMTVALTFERSGAHGGESLNLLEEAEAWARKATGPDGRARLADPSVRERLARAATETEVAILLSRRSAWVATTGALPGVEGSMAKLYGSEILIRQSEDFVDMLGPDGIRDRADPRAPEGGDIEHALRFALARSIYGGTSEIQRGIIAQRGLGLPKAR